MSEYRGRPVETHHNLAKTKKIIKQGHTTTYDGQEELVRKSECVQSYAVDSQIASEVIIMISGTTSIDIPCVTLSQIVKEEIETQRHTTGEIRCDCVLAGGRRGDGCWTGTNHSNNNNNHHQHRISSRVVVVVSDVS